MTNYKNIKNLESNRQKWLQDLQAGNDAALQQLYIFYRNNFIKWLTHKTSCDETLALDVFQESVLALYRNVQQGKLTHFEKSIRSYLFTIGKYLYLQKIRKKQITTTEITWEAEISPAVSLAPDESVIQNEQQKLLLNLLQKMKEPCHSILHAFYYQNKSIKEIAQQLNYQNSNVVKVQKARCMSRLRIKAKKIEEKLR